MSTENISAVNISKSLTIEPIASQTALSPTKSSEAISPIEFKSDAKAGPDELKKAVDAANEMFNQVRPDIKFVIDESTQDVVIVLLEPETGDVINRYPTEQAMAISNAIVESQARVAENLEVFQKANEQLSGLLVQQKI